MNKEFFKTNPLLLGRLQLFGLTEMHKEGFDGRGVKIGLIDCFETEHGYNTESCIIEPPVNGQMFGTAPCATVIRYPLPKKFYATDVERALKECIVDEVDIINMSLSTTTDAWYLEKVVKECYAKNILMVCAAGNSGLNYMDHIDIKEYPEEYKETISVGSINSDLSWSSFESHGKSIDFVGIGKSTVVKNKDGVYQFATGTSFSCPQLTGLFACVLSKFKSQGINTLIADLKQYVLDMSVDLGAVGKDNFYGTGFPTMDINEYKETRRSLGVIERKIELQIGNKIMKIDGKEVEMDTQPVIDSNSRTLVPLRAISEALGIKVEWDGVNNKITLID